MNRTKPPFRADHVGSLLRPPKHLRAREDHQAGRISADALRRVEDESIREAIKLQEDVGLQAVTDGEYRRASWHMDFLYQIGGITKAQDNLKVKFHNDVGNIEFAPAAISVSGKLTLKDCIFGDDFKFLKAKTKAVAKLTIPSPNMVHYRGGRAAIEKSIYPEMDQFWLDLQQVYADEIERLGRIGCTYLQLDDTSLAYLNDPNQRQHVTEIGGDGEHQHLTYIKNLNAAIAKRPSGMTVCTHMCRGNFRSSWIASGGYDYVAEALFSGLNVDGFFLEYDDARSGTFAPLRFVPKGKMVVLGLVTTKRPALEKKEDLKRRIDEASKYVPLEQLCLSPQCGFSSTFEGNALTMEDQLAKLRLIVETAREVWG